MESQTMPNSITKTEGVLLILFRDQEEQREVFLLDLLTPEARQRCTLC